jgi:3-hydroxyacyl-CoA dehydrogenase / 3-hydroxy-2-methylbutyryl-CoA dehydrogenase
MVTAARTVAIISGANSGLGAATATALLRHGAKVLVADLTDLGLSHWESLGAGTPATAIVDVTDPHQVKRALDQAEQVFGEPVNVAVNCAGIAVAEKTLSRKGHHTAEAFSSVMRINALGSFYLASQAAERMAKREADDNGLRGCIINTASIAAYEGQVGQVAYAASKGAIVGMTLPMARDLAPYGIRVMTIVSSRIASMCLISSKPSLQAPGLFLTPLLEALPVDVQQTLGSSVPCPSRLGRPEEFAQLVIDVIGNPMLNGSVIRLDGALRMPP